MNPLEIYLSRFDARLFPCLKPDGKGDPRAKQPAVDGWRIRDYSESKILKAWGDGHPIAWALSETDLVVDVDAPTEYRPDSRGLESLEKLNNLLGAPLIDVATAVKTGETGGLHFYLKVEPGLSLRKSVDELPGIDFKYFGGYVVTAGSPHWLGGTYKFAPESLLNDFPQPECPSILLDLMERPAYESKGGSTSQISGDILAQLLNCLDVNDYSNHASWYPIFAASHQSTGGTKDGLHAFLDWSISDPKYENDAGLITKRWHSLHASKDGGITIGTLFDAVIDAGGSDVVSIAKAYASFDDEEFEDDYGLFDDDDFDTTGLFDDPKPKKRKKKKKQKKRIADDPSREYQINDEAISELAKIPNLFQRAKFLVSINGADILPLNPLGVCEQLSTVVEIGNEVETKSGPDKGNWEWKPKRISERTGKQIVARSAWFGVRRLKTVTTVPVLTSTGILQTEGYDAASGVFYSKTLDIAKIREPSLEDAQTAAETLFELVQDFPFAGQSHRSAWLASLLTVLGRPAINGPVPMTFIDGNQRGVGKGLLTDLIYLIVAGENMPTNPSMPKEEKLDTLLLSIAMQNCPVYCFDNIPTGSQFGSASLDSVLTTGSISGRPFFKQTIEKYPIETVFFASGNRIAINANSDIIRRLNYIHLKSKEERAESRSDFVLGGAASLRDYARTNRASLIHAALTILEYGRLNGDGVKIKSSGSYEAYSKVVRRAIVAIGLDDPLSTRDDLESADQTRGELEIVICAFEAIGAIGQKNGLTAAELIDKLSGDGFEDDPTLHQAKELLSPRGTDNPALRCGVRLSRSYRDQVSNGRWIRKHGCPSKKMNVFWVEETE